MTNERIYVNVDQVYHPDHSGSNVSTAVGRTDDGNIVRFAGEARMLNDVALAIEMGDEPCVGIEAWQIISAVGVL